MAGWLTLVPGSDDDLPETPERTECRIQYAKAVLLSVDPLCCYNQEVYTGYARYLVQQWSGWETSLSTRAERELLLREIVRRSFEPELVATGHVTEQEVRLITDGISPLFLLHGGTH